MSPFVLLTIGMYASCKTRMIPDAYQTANNMEVRNCFAFQECCCVPAVPQVLSSFAFQWSALVACASAFMRKARPRHSELVSSRIITMSALVGWRHLELDWDAKKKNRLAT